MCGIGAVAGPGVDSMDIEALTAHLGHRGPDAQWTWSTASGGAALGQDRLAIVDLSSDADRPLVSPSGRRLAFNGEIYNHVELRRELDRYPFRTQTDTEVLLAAHETWGDACFDRLLGMFAAVLWDPRERTLVAVRDRFGVKPLYYHHAPDGTLTLASEIGALFAAGVEATADAAAWSAYLGRGVTDEGERTFWHGVRRLPAGHLLRWQDGELRISCWYDLAERVGPAVDRRSEAVVTEEYRALLEDSVRLRFRADVPVGIALSGGLDSATLLALVDRVGDRPLTTYTFLTGDERYDERPWVEQMLAGTPHTARWVPLAAAEVPELTESVQATQDEPYGGIPTLAYARLFEAAREDGTIVLMDGQGLDEQWAGYDYYGPVAEGTGDPGSTPLVQGAAGRLTRAECLVPGFARLDDTSEAPRTFADPVRGLQHRDLTRTKLPRALRFNDRSSMRASTELREPFLDHRLVELALRQPTDRKWRDGTGKWLLRSLAATLVPATLALAPKRPVQTPQREWLRGPLEPWAQRCVADALDAVGDRWLDTDAVHAAWKDFATGQGDNAFFAWQWVNLGLAVRQRPDAFMGTP